DQRCAECGVVEFVGQRLEPADRPAWFHVRRWVGFGATLWKIDGRPAVRADGLDKCDICRQRSARPGKESRARACCGLRDCGGPLFTGQCRLPGRAAVSGNTACAAKSRSRGDDERRLRSSGRYVHGCGDHDFYVLMIAALMVLRRKRPDAERPYRTWGYPLVPIISILVAGLLIIDLAFLAPATSGIGMFIVLTGVPVYFFWRKRAAARTNPSRT